MLLWVGEIRDCGYVWMSYKGIGFVMIYWGVSKGLSMKMFIWWGGVILRIKELIFMRGLGDGCWRKILFEWGFIKKREVVLVNDGGC